MNLTIAAKDVTRFWSKVKERASAIKEALRSGKTKAATAREFGVSFGAIRNIVLGLSWRHVA